MATTLEPTALRAAAAAVAAAAAEAVTCCGACVRGRWECSECSECVERVAGARDGIWQVMCRDPRVCTGTPQSDANTPGRTSHRAMAWQSARRGSGGSKRRAVSVYREGVASGKGGETVAEHGREEESAKDS